MVVLNPEIMCSRSPEAANICLLLLCYRAFREAGLLQIPNVVSVANFSAAYLPKMAMKNQRLVAYFEMVIAIGENFAIK